MQTCSQSLELLRSKLATFHLTTTSPRVQALQGKLVVVTVLAQPGAWWGLLAPTNHHGPLGEC